MDHRESNGIPLKSTFYFIDYAKVFDCVDHNKLWKILKEMEHQTTLPVSWETCMQVKKQELKSDMELQTGSTLGKEYISCISSPCLFNLYAEYIMQNAGLKESQAGIKIARRNIKQPQICKWNHLNGRKQRGPKLLITVKEESEKAGLKLNIQETKIMVSSPITSWQIDGNSSRFYFLGLQKSLWMVLQLQN